MRLWTYLTEQYRAALDLEIVPLQLPRNLGIVFISEGASLPSAPVWQWIKAFPKGRVKAAAGISEAVIMDKHTYVRDLDGGWRRVTPDLTDFRREV